jgi:hypothetical protein
MLCYVTQQENWMESGLNICYDIAYTVGRPPWSGRYPFATFMERDRA